MLPAWGLCALLVACGPPTWAGGIHALMAWSERGVRVTEVPPGPAARAGLRAGDVLVAIDGKSLAGLSSREVQRMLRGEVGTMVELEIEREGARERLRVERAPYETSSSKRAGPRASSDLDRAGPRASSDLDRAGPRAS